MRWTKTAGLLLIGVLVAAPASAQVDRVIAALELASGQKVADVGAGAGRYSRPLARAVAPEGVVYAIDISENALERNARAAAAEGIANIETVLAEEDDPKIPEPVDLAFFSDSLHHINGQETYLKNLRRYLNPGARVAVIDFARNWPRAHHIRRYTVEELDAWMRAAGFSRIALYDFPADRFFAIYR